MKVLQVSFFQAEILPVLIFLALFFLVIGGGIRIANRIKAKPGGEDSSLFAEMFAEQPQTSDDAHSAWNGTAEAQAGVVRNEHADWSDMTPAEQTGSADWNGTAGGKERD